MTEGNRQSGRRLGGAVRACDSLGEPQRVAGKAPAWEGQRRKRRSKRRLAADAKHDRFASLGRNHERAKRPIPKGKRKAEILVEMSRIYGVMELVMGRTL